MAASSPRALIVPVRRTFERRSPVVAITSEVLNRCMRPFPVEPIRTLDAIHLATMETLGELPQFVTLVSRSERVRANGRALGYAVTSPQHP